MGERQFGPYRLVRQIAVGGMAEIHLAKTKGIAGFEKYVALKMIHPNFAADDQFIQMLVDEAKIAVQLNHGNIAQTFDLGRVGDTFYITMEYVDGADLYKILRRGSEMDGYEMPLDVCAFIAKEVASALDHAHRKRDHSGKTLGIVHRDVSPQNVLISYSGEVKLVDFGIAKATMKVRQTAVGVIKGKYYYMSPEQAWGDQLDYRSDIFSAGIVLYEMITGQMLYLEEDLTRLLEMVRKADIAPPSTLRRGVPPQLEKIVMHALAKDRRDRYQSAGDFATDLERFLHAYSPVFTAAKVSNLMKHVIGDPVAVNEEVEQRDGPLSTHTLTSEDLIQDKEELAQDENSVIFRVADLRPKSPTEGRDSPRKKQSTGAAPVAGARPKQPSGASPVASPRPKQPTGGVPAGPRVTRQADIREPSRPKSITAVPSIPKISPQPMKKAPTPAAGQRQPQQRPRDANEVTRQVEPIRPGPDNTEDSGLLGLTGPGPSKSTALAWKKHDGVGTHPGDDLENIGESTMISGAPAGFGGFMMDNAAEDGDGATMISSQPPSADDTNPENDALDTGTFAGETQDDVVAAPPRRETTEDEDDDGDSEDGPTMQRDFRESAKPRVSAGRAAPPPALAAKIHAPAVSEIRKPRASRKTPHAGIAQGNVLQAIVGAKPSEPMPTPRAAPTTPARTDDSGAMTMPERPSPFAAPHPDLDGASQATVLEASGQGSAHERGPMQQRTMLGQTSPLAGARPGGSQPPANRAATPSQAMPVRPGPSQPPPMGGPPQAGFSGYATDASGMPLSTPPSGSPTVPQPGSGAYPYQGYPGQPGYPPQAGSGGWPAAGAPPGYPQPGYPGYVAPGQSGNYPQQVSPGALYQLQPTGAPPPQPMTLTGQLRLFEADELADKYKLSTGAPKWLKIVLASVIAISVAAGVTFFIIKATRDTAPRSGSVHVESVPPGAEVVFDGTRIAGSTPLTIDGVPTGTRHDVRVELAHYKPYTETVDIPKKGGEIAVRATMEEVTGKLTVITQPDGVEIWIDGVLKGKAPTTITGIEMSSAKKLELRLDGYAPVILDLVWPANGEIGINQRMVK